MTDEQIAHAKRATDRAKAVIKPGDWVSRTMCMGVKSRFKFTHWDGDWACGRSVYDAHAMHIYAVNGAPVDFKDGGAS